MLECGKYDEIMARSIFKRVLLGMTYLHNTGITHRDMKLENLLLGERHDLDSVKICDLGLAKKATEQLMKVRPSEHIGYRCSPRHLPHSVPVLLAMSFTTRRCEHNLHIFHHTLHIHHMLKPRLLSDMDPSA